MTFRRGQLFLGVIALVALALGAPEETRGVTATADRDAYMVDDDGAVTGNPASVTSTDGLAPAMPQDGGVGAGTSGAVPDQTSWTEVSGLDTLAGAALSSDRETGGKLYLAAVAASSHMYYTTIESPDDGWTPWSSVGTGHDCTGTPCFDLAKHFDPETRPILLRDDGTATLHLLARGTDNNLYRSSRGLSDTDWQGTDQGWDQLTSGSPVRGRISAVLTRSKAGDAFVHVVYSSTNDSVEYRRYRLADWSPVGAPEQWSNAVEATIGTDGANEVWAFVRTTGSASLLVEKKQSPWTVPWSRVETITGDPGGGFFDISNVVFFARTYHVVYDQKYLADDIGPTYGHSVIHARFRSGLPLGDNVRTIWNYTPSTSGHPKAQLAVYRNKLIVGFKDEEGWIRYSRWDTADPSGPWVPASWEPSNVGLVAGGRSDSRPALATFNSGLPSGFNIQNSIDDGSVKSAGNQFGNDLFAVVHGFSTDRLWFVNFGRVALKQYLEQIGVAVNYGLDDPPPAATVFDDRAYLFVMGRGRNVWYKSSADGMVWDQNWNSIGGDFGFTAKPEGLGVAAFGGKLHVFIAHWNDRDLRMKTFDGSSWSSWTSLPSMPSNRSAAKGPIATPLGNRLHVFAQTDNGRIYTISTDGATWGSWTSLPELPNQCDAGATKRPCQNHWAARSTGAVQAYDGRIHLFARVDTAVDETAGESIHNPTVWYISSDTNGSWAQSAWSDLGLLTPSDPAVAVHLADLHVFARDRWGAVWQNLYNGAAFSGWSRLPPGSGLTTSGPTATAFQDEVQVFIRGSDYQIWRMQKVLFPWPDDWSRNDPAGAADLYGPFEPEVKNLPGFTEAGYAFWALPHWMMGHLFTDSVADAPAAAIAECSDDLHRRLGAHVSGVYKELSSANTYPIWLRFNITPVIWCGDHIDYRNAYDNGVWDEVAHTLANAIGLEYNPGQSQAKCPGRNLEPGLSDTAMQQACNGLFDIPCSSNMIGGRPVGAIARGCDSIQHRWMYPMIEYFRNGDQLRAWIREDEACTSCTAEEQTLLRRKYDWYREYIFGGVEFRLHSELVSPVGHDDLSGAIEIAGLPFNWNQDVEGATLQAGEPTPCGGTGGTVWYSYTAPIDGQVTVSTEGSDFLSAVAVYTGNSVGSLSVVADSCGEAGVVTFSATKGTTYRIQVGDLLGSMGKLELSATGKQPHPGDTDGDGCSDEQENGPDETLGGQRNYLNPYDFYDVSGDQVIELFADILQVIGHFAPTGTEPEYDATYDRGPTAGPNQWNMTAPDGKIELFVDILGVIGQHGHDCR